MISSHILDELAKVADWFGIINEGTLLDEFSADELHHRCGRYVMIRTGNPAGTVKVLKEAGVKGIETEADGTLRVNDHLDDTPAMARAIVQAGIDLQEISLCTISLEDYYLNVTKGGAHNG
jgi:ABC-2 type transport system ATP-binding protein